MKVTAIATAVLLAGSVIAAPGTAMRKARAAGRRNPGKQSKPMVPSSGEVQAKLSEISNISHVEYSTNWAGAVLIGTGYTSVTGTFTIPTPSTTGSGSAWVGIDGDTCGTAILQTGVDWTRSSSGRITYDAWYEWYPDYAYDFRNGITLAAGNVITVTVTASSKTGGTAVIKNTSTGTSVTHKFSNEASLGSLCEYNAEWIVEDFQSGSSLVPFANFGTVTFTGASATKSGTKVGVTGASILDIEQTNVLTNCALVGSTGVTCSYI
ncbi:protease acp1 [Amylocarpus encephaloides]|uniref:Protease acp1 n=1 Tax=Amylocarpus encephaloides TaxID=45428 RepID=A0A9P7YD92_9HELO|nr:protease acp1 [Amylocarpus encephaloides]